MTTAPPASLTIGSLFTGVGGLEMGIQAVIPSRAIWHCEFEPPSRHNPKPTQAAAKVLAHHWPEIPNLGDISLVDWSTVERPDILAGGFPCTDVSLAGARAGLAPGTRSGLWAQFLHAIDQLRPSLVVIENVRGLLSARGAPPTEELLAAWAELDKCDRVIKLLESKRRRAIREGKEFYVRHHTTDRVRFLGRRKRAVAAVRRADARIVRALGAVLGGLASIGYDAQWCGLRAADVGAPHGRFRIFILAWPAAGHPGHQPGGSAADPGGEALTRGSGLRPRESVGCGRRRSDDDCQSDAADTLGDRMEGRDSSPAATSEAGQRPDPHSGGRPADRRSRESAADTQRLGRDGRAREQVGGQVGGAAAAGGGQGARGSTAAATDASGGRWAARQSQPARDERGSDADRGGDEAAGCPTCGDPTDVHDAGGFCAGLCGGTCDDPDWGRPDALPDSHGDAVRQQPVADAGGGGQAVAGRGGVPAAADAEDGGQPQLAGGPDGRERRAAWADSERIGERSGLGAGAGSGPRRSAEGAAAAADADGGRRESGPELDSDPAQDSADRDPCGGHADGHPGAQAWGPYEPAIRRWESVLGRLAGPPTEPGTRGGPRLAPKFVEWMQGLPAGHVTDPVIGISRNDQLRALGNTVVPQQAAEAVRWLLEAIAREGAAA